MSKGKSRWSDWVYPVKGYLMKCCDCGLVHELDFGAFVEGRKKGKYFDVVQLPKQVRVMFRVKRK